MSLATIAIVSVVAVGATRAYFVDTESVTGNTFAAGSLDLELDNAVSLPFNVSNIVPGDTGEGKITLTNVDGSLDGDIDVNISNLVEDENGCLEPEVEAGDPCGAGDLGLALKMAMFLDVNQDGIYDQADGDIELEYSGNTNTTAGLQFANVTSFVDKKWDDVMSLTSNQSVDLIIQYEFKENAYAKPDAIYMTDTLVFDVDTSLEQVGGEGGVAN